MEMESKMKHKNENLAEYDAGTRQIVATIYAVAISQPEELRERYLNLIGQVYELGKKIPIEIA